MSKTINLKGKKVSVKKRELVIPFDNEHLFVVPKKGGFGQHDNDKYVMVAGGTSIGNVPSPTDTTQIGQGVGSTTSTSTSTTHSQAPSTPILTTPPRVTTTTPIVGTITDVIPCTSYTFGSWSACTNGLQTRTYVGVPSGCTGTPPLTDTEMKCTTTSDLPTFPDWSTLDCTSLKDWIDRINSTLATSKFSADIATAYSNALASANATYTTKCYTNPTPIVVVPTPTTETPLGGSGGIGGGGGGGSTDDSLPQVEEKKSNNGLFLILGIAGLVYFLTRK